MIPCYLGENFFGAGEMALIWLCSKVLGLRHTQNFPFGFTTTTSPLTQSVGLWTGSVISKSIIRFESFSNLSFKARGIFLTGVTTGVILSVISKW